MTRHPISRLAIVFIASLALTTAASAQVNFWDNDDLSTAVSQLGWAYPFTLIVYSPTVLHDVTVTYTTPANTGFDYVATRSGVTCSVPAYGASGTVRCTTPTLEGSAGVPFVRIYLIGKAPGIVTNTASMTYPGLAVPMTLSRDFVIGGGPLQFTSIVAQQAAKAGADETFNITLTNTGAVPATGTFELDVPAGGVFLGTATPGISCVGTGAAGTASCALPTLSAGGKVDLQLLTRLPAATGVVTYNVALRLPVYGRVIALPQLVAVTARDVQLTAQVLPASPIVAPGSDTAVTLRVKNLGTDETTPLNVTAVVSPSLSVRSVSSNSGGTCTAVPSVVCSGIVLAGGASADVTLVARAASTFATAIVTGSASSLTATAKSAQAQIVIGENAATTTVTTFTPDRDTATAGKPLTYKASVTNSGATDAYTLKTRIVLSSGGSITSAAGDGFTCTVQQQYAVDCETPLLAHGTTAVATLDVVAPPDPVTAVGLTATTTALNAPTQSVAVATPIGGSQRDVAVAAQESTLTTVTGQRTSIHFDVTNPSSTDANNVTLDASLTPGLMLDSIATTAGSCVATHCTLGTLKAGAKETVTVTVVAASAGAQSVGAAITCDAEESTAANDAASVSVNVTRARSRGVRH